jgi:hypothetical protein
MRLGRNRLPPTAKVEATAGAGCQRSGICQLPKSVLNHARFGGKEAPMLLPTHNHPLVRFLSKSKTGNLDY